MEDLTMSENQSINGNAVASVAMGFVLGALVGAGVALLLAPQSGKDTRQQLADTGRRLGNAARSKLDQTRDTVNDLKQDAKAALAAGRETFERDQSSREPHSSVQTTLKG